MATGRISIYDRVAQRPAPLVDCAEPHLDSANAPWLGIKLEHYCLGASERPEASTTSYLCVVGLNGSYPTKYGATLGQRAFNVTFKPGSIFLTGPGDLPARASTGEFEFLALEVAPKFVMWVGDELANSGPFEVQQLWGAQDEQLRYIALTLYNELLVGCPSGRLFGEYMGLSFATALLSNHSAGPARMAHYRGGLPPYKLRQVTEFISENLSRNLTLAEMANLLQMGPCHFARAFKESTGLSPHQFVLRRRVERALQMLKETRNNLADIAYDLGFSSQGHFTTVFSKIVGVSPSNYREQARPLKTPQLCYGSAASAAQ